MSHFATLLVSGLLAGAGLTACGNQGAGAAGGDVVEGHLSDKVSGASSYVLLPTGRIDLTVGKPVDEVTADQAGDGEKHTAPDGGAFVPLTWSHDPFGEGGVPIGVIGADPQEADIVLVSGDTKADLGSPYQLAGDQGTTDTGVGTMYVAVDGDGKSPTFEATYDGLTQTVDPATGDRDAGAAAPLYDEPTMGVEATCPSEGFTSGNVVPTVACVLTPQRTPYLPGQGWAADGHTWLLLSGDITVDEVEVGRATYDVTSVQPLLRLEGADPVAVTDKTWAFDATSGGSSTLEVSLDLVLAKTSGPGPSTRQETVQQSVDLGAG